MLVTSKREIDKKTLSVTNSIKHGVNGELQMQHRTLQVEIISIYVKITQNRMYYIFTFEKLELLKIDIHNARGCQKKNSLKKHAF